MNQGRDSVTGTQTAGQSPRTLIVLATPVGVRGWGEVVALLRNYKATTTDDWLLYETVMTKSITEVAIDLRARIDQEFITRGQYDAVVLVGISIGAIVTRQAYLLALGGYPNHPTTLGWGALVTRIVLIAGPNRGIGFDSFSTLVRGFLRAAISLVPTTRYFLDLLTGSDYLTDLKIRWVHHFRNAKSALPLVVNVVPARSRFVPRASMIDQVQFPRARYFDVPGVNDVNLRNPQRYVHGSAPLAILISALFEELALGPELEPSDVDCVVFVLHGIRASNTGWVSQASNYVKEISPKAEVVVATYGYYSLLRFPFALSRRRNVRWFQDLYSYNFAKYPGATFYFIGHSYGTYILGQSMARVPAMRFSRIVLVGSVLPREYRWSDRIDSGQTQEIRNDRSSRDVPVKLICSALHAFGKDVGTAGVDGFDEGRCLETFYYKGSHSRPLDRDNLANLVDYLLRGSYSRPAGLVDEISRPMDIVSRLAPAIGLAVICAVLGIVPGVWWIYLQFGISGAGTAAMALVLVAVLLDAI